MDIEDILFNDDKTSATSGYRSEQAKFKSLSSPTLKEEGKFTQGITGSVEAGIPIDKTGAIQVLSKRTGLPVNRFVIDDEGNIGYKGDDGKYYKAIGSQAGYYFPDVMQGILDVGAGAVATAGSGGLLGPMVISGGGSAGIELGRQEIANQLTGVDNYDPLRTTISGGAGAIGEVFPSAWKMIRKNRLAKDIDTLDTKNIEQILRLSKKYDVPLTIPEITNLVSLQQKQSVLGKLSFTAKELDDFYQMRMNKVETAVNKYLNDISVSEDIGQAGMTVQQALKDRKEQLIKERFDASKPFYDKAFEDAAPVNAMPIVQKIDNLISEFPENSSQLTTFQKAKSMFFKTSEKPKIDPKTGKQILDRFGQPVVEATKTLQTDPKILQRVKMELDAMLRREEGVSIGKVARGELKGIRDMVNDVLKSDNPYYKQADQVYERFTKPLDEFNDREVIKSIESANIDKAKDIAKKLFKDRDPATVKYAKEQIMAVNPQAWDDISRAWLKENWNQATKVFRASKGANVDAGLSWRNLLFQTQEQERVLRQTLSPEQYRGLEELALVLERAGSVQKHSSDTAFFQEAHKQLKASGWDLFDIDLMKPQGTIFEVLKQKSFEKNADKFANLILNPENLNKISELRKLGSRDPVIASAVIKLLTQPSTYGGPSNLVEQSRLEREQTPQAGDTSVEDILFD